MFNVTAMERSILAELFERGGRGQLSGLRDRRPIERLVNKGFVERHTLKSSRQQVDKDRRTAEQRDELAPSYVEHGASPPLRALGAGNDYQPANGPQPCRQEITSKAAVRTGAPGAETGAFRKRFLAQFQDPAFDALAGELDKIARCGMAS